MGEMISSFDGTKLYLNKEIPEKPKAALVIVHGLCEHQGRAEVLPLLVMGDRSAISLVA